MTTLRPLIKWWLALAGAALLVRAATTLPTTDIPESQPAAQQR